MLRLLGSISPLLVLLIGAMPAVTAGWFARGVIFERIERPALIRTQEQICTAEVQAAAAQARAEEQLRQFRAGEQATESFIRQSQRVEAARAADQALLQQEVDRYAVELAKRDRLCGLTSEDLIFLGAGS